MSGASLFLVVEGRKVDRSFYDRVLEELSGLSDRDYEICLAEDIELNGKSAAGKRHVVALFGEWQAQGRLKQTNSAGPRRIAVALDRDLDEIAGRIVGADHVFYSNGADVEADILRYGDLALGVAHAYSITRALASSLLPSGDVFAHLSQVWREWLLLAARGAACGSSVSYGRRSLINEESGFGPTDPVRSTAFRATIDSDAVSNGKLADADLAESAMLAALSTSDSWRVVKGKWVAEYVHYIIERARLGGEVIESGVSPGIVVKTCLASLRLQGDLAAHHEASIAAVLSS